MIPKNWLVRKISPKEIDQRWALDNDGQKFFRVVNTWRNGREDGYLVTKNSFVKQVMEGGELWSFDNKQWHSLSGRRGFVLYRGGTEVSSIVIEVS